MTRRPGSGIGGIEAARALRAARLALPAALTVLAVSAAVTLHVRKATRAEPEQQKIFRALGIDPAPGGIRKMIV